MVLANETVATHVFKQKLPFVSPCARRPARLLARGAAARSQGARIPYRGAGRRRAGAAFQRVLEAAAGRADETLVVNYVVLRSMERARYSAALARALRARPAGTTADFHEPHPSELSRPDGAPPAQGPACDPWQGNSNGSRGTPPRWNASPKRPSATASSSRCASTCRGMWGRCSRGRSLETSLRVASHVRLREHARGHRALRRAS